MSVPNTTPGTAVAVTLPWTLEIDISIGNIPDAAWYRFTTSASTYLLSMQVAQDDHAYFGAMSLYESDGTTRVTSPDGVQLTTDWEDPINQPVDPRTVYYMQVQGDNGSPPGTLATFTTIANPNLSMPAGSILISNDEPGFPALIMSPGGAILRAVAFSTGEQSDILQSGIILADTRNDAGNIEGVLELRNTDDTFSIIATIDDPLSTAKDYAITCNHTNKFWIASPVGFGESFTFKSVTPAGVVGVTTYAPTPQNLNFTAVKLDNSLLYFTTQVSDAPVYTFNITGNADGANFAAGVTDYLGRDIVVLSDGTLVVVYTGHPDSTLNFIRHYSAAGATLHDVSITSGYYHDHICRNGSSATDIIWWQESITNPRTHLIQRIQLSDGTPLDSFTQPIYESGEADYPAARFGASASCPIIVLNTATVVQPTIGATTHRKMRRVRRAPHLWDGEAGARIFYPGFQLLVETGADRPDLTTIARYALRWSDDGGFTWSNEYWVEAGTIGQYKLRALWRRLGYSRDRIFEVIDDFDGKSTILDALLVPDPIQGAG